MKITIEKLPIEFGKAVRQERQRQGLSQENLALEANLDRTYVSGIERGVRNPSLKNIGKLARALDISPRKFF